MTTKHFLLSLTLASTIPSHAAPGAGFSLRDEPGQHLDVMREGKLVARYMYAHDASTPEKRAETYKPYLHLFNATGTAPITKGLGGQFPHHRGLFVGWNKIGFGGKTYDRWHMTGGEQVHRKFVLQEADEKQATVTALVHWNDEKGAPILEEERTFVFRRAAAPAYALADLSSKFSAPSGDVSLDGDPEHAGVQFRPSLGIDPKQTAYTFPRENAQPTKDRDYPWVGAAFTIGGERVSIVQISAPTNPAQTRWSAYRDYGRFGAFARAAIKKGESVTLRYRFLVAAGEMPSAEAIQKVANEFTGQDAPAPKVTVVPVAKPTAK